MATTSPDNIYSPDSNDQYALVQDLGAMADSVQDALVSRANSYRGTSAQRNAFTTAPTGTIWSDTNGDQHMYVRRGSSWVQITQEDTGWVSLALMPGFTGLVRYRVVGAVGSLVYDIQGPAGSFGGSSSVPLTSEDVPAEFRPYSSGSGLLDSPLVDPPSMRTQLVPVMFLNGSLSRVNFAGAVPGYGSLTRIRGNFSYLTS